MEQDGKLSATQAKAVLADLLEHGGDPAEIAAATGLRGPRRGFAGRPSWPRWSPPTPTSGQRYVGGEDKLTGFFTGQVMEATDKKANGKAVAAELRRRRG